MKKKILSIIVSLCLSIGGFAVTVSAGEETVRSEQTTTAETDSLDIVPDEEENAEPVNRVEEEQEADPESEDSKEENTEESAGDQTESVTDNPDVEEDSTDLADTKGEYLVIDGEAVTKSGTYVVDGKKYWVNADGYLAYGWLHLGNWKMYYSPETYEASVGITEIDGKHYMFNDDGVMQTKAGTPVINGKKYWFSTDDASLKTGWLKLGDWKLYFDPETYAACTGITKIDGNAYLFDTNGIWQQKSGTPVVNGKKYWINGKGFISSGWLYLTNWKMYFNPETFEACLGINEIGGKHYMFNNSGVMQTNAGTPVINGKKYWFSTDDASLKTGWLNLGNMRLYFDPEEFYAVTNSILVIDGYVCTFDNNGLLISVKEKRGPVPEGDTWVLYNENGQKITEDGTPVVDGHKYWVKNGVLKSGWLDISGSKLYFDHYSYMAYTNRSFNYGGYVCYFNSQSVLYAMEPQNSLRSDIAYVQWAIDVANNDTVGYGHSWLYDQQTISCAGLVGMALEFAGYGDFVWNGTEYGYQDDDDLFYTLLDAGFTRLVYDPASVQPGDILFQMNPSDDPNDPVLHIGFYAGSGYTVESRGPEGYNHTDENGYEIAIFSNPHAWTYMYRPNRIVTTREAYGF